jgi:hypothetical protein
VSSPKFLLPFGSVSRQVAPRRVPCYGFFPYTRGEWRDAAIVRLLGFPVADTFRLSFLFPSDRSPLWSSSLAPLNVPPFLLRPYTDSTRLRRLSTGALSRSILWAWTFLILGVILLIMVSRFSFCPVGSVELNGPSADSPYDASLAYSANPLLQNHRSSSYFIASGGGGVAGPPSPAWLNGRPASYTSGSTPTYNWSSSSLSAMHGGAPPAAFRHSASSDTLAKKRSRSLGGSGPTSPVGLNQPLVKSKLGHEEATEVRRANSFLLQARTVLIITFVSADTDRGMPLGRPDHRLVLSSVITYLDRSLFCCQHWRTDSWRARGGGGRQGQVQGHASKGQEAPQSQA